MIVGFLIVSGLVLLPPILFALAPQRVLGMSVGVAALGIGTGWLHERNVPFFEQGWAGTATWLFTAWAFVLAVATFVRVTALVRYRPEAADEEVSPTPVSPWLGWQVPIGLLLAIFFMHWLRNRIAGFEPAWLAHAMLLVPAIVALVLLGKWVRKRPRVREHWEPWMDPRPLSASILAGVAIVVIANGWTAWDHYALARERADGRPFCMLTFAGRNRERQAHTILELSPLVSRWGAHGFDRFGAPWLFFDRNAPTASQREEERERGRWKREGAMTYRDAVIRPARRATPTKAFPCTREKDGGVSSL